MGVGQSEDLDEFTLSGCQGYGRIKFDFRPELGEIYLDMVDLPTTMQRKGLPKTFWAAAVKFASDRFEDGVKELTLNADQMWGKLPAHEYWYRLGFRAASLSQQKPKRARELQRKFSISNAN